MTEQYANLADSTLTADVTSGALSVSVAAGTGSRFPASGDFRLLLQKSNGTERELALCTARVGDVLTVSRGIEGTTARAHVLGDQVVHVLTVASLDAKADEAQTAAEATAAGALASHASDSTVVHGLADTADVVLTDDSRLTDARPPTAHKTTHETGGTDVVGITHAQTTGQTANDHHAEVHAINSADHTGTLDDAQIPAAIARDTEVTSAISTHAGAADPHTGYELESAHTKAAHDALGLSHDSLADVSANDHHAQAHSVIGADHTNFPGGTTDFLRADGTFAVPSGGAPTGADYLVGTAQGGLSAEIVVGATPGGELGGTWAIPTVDGTHSGSAHHSALTIGADSEHSLAGQVLSGVDASTSQKGHAQFDGTAPVTQAFGDAAAAGSSGVIADRAHKHGMPADPVTAHAAAADPHTGYVLESLIDAAGDLYVGSADNTPARLAHGTLLQRLVWNGSALAWLPHIVRKTSNETVNNSNTVQNDDELLWAVAANEIYFFQLWLRWNGASITSDLKVGWSVPAGCTMEWGSIEPANNAGGWARTSSATTAVAVGSESNTTSSGSGAAAAAVHTMFAGHVFNGANAGNVNLQWAQNTATVEDTIVSANSILLLWRLV